MRSLYLSEFCKVKVITVPSFPLTGNRFLTSFKNFQRRNGFEPVYSICLAKPQKPIIKIHLIPPMSRIANGSFLR